jgi:hypothetical protein
VIYIDVPGPEPTARLTAAWRRFWRCRQRDFHLSRPACLRRRWHREPCRRFYRGGGLCVAPGGNVGYPRPIPVPELDETPEEWWYRLDSGGRMVAAGPRRDLVA